MYKRGAFGALQALLLDLGGAELQESAPSSSQDQAFRYRGVRKDNVLSLLCPIPTSYLLAISRVNSRLFSGMALIVT